MIKINKEKTYRGFTLIELLVVIAIIALLSTVVLSSLQSARERGEAARAASDLREIITTLNLYYDDNGVYPCFDHSWDDGDETSWAAPYFQWPEHPWGYEYHWEHGGSSFSISLRSPGTDNAQNLDNLIDDGNLGTGNIRGNGTRLEYYGMDQGVTLIDCHI